MGKLPPVLCLQLDNCFRENKNSYVVNFVGWLTERGIDSFHFVRGRVTV